MRGIFIIAVAVGLLAGCRESGREVRHYKEINFTVDKQEVAAPVTVAAAATPAAAAPVPSPSAMPDLPPSMVPPVVPLAWVVPDGWQDLGPSGIRLTTLVVEGQECTILTFPGDVGGDAANIRRWLGQIGHQVSDDALAALVARAARLITQGGFEARWYDLADLMPPGAPVGTLAGIVPVGDQTAFIKFTGDAAVLARHREAFRSLVASIRLPAEGI